MKIAYFTDTYIPQINGVTYVVDSHARLLVKKHQVKIYAPAYGLKGEVEYSQDGKLSIEKYPSLPVLFYTDIHFPFVDLYKMYKSVKSFRPDIIHFHTPGPIGSAAVILAKYLKIPLIATYHTLWSETLPPLPPFKIIDIFFKNQVGKKDLLRDVIWKMSNKIFDYCKIIISPADIIRDEIVLHQSKLEIVGDGPELQPLKNLTKKLHLEEVVKFTGFIKREGLNKYYNSCDVFITGSTMEVQPLTILEAMSSGLPIIGIAKAGVAGLVKNNANGFLIPTQNSIEMASKIVEVLSDNNLRIKLSKNSRKIAVTHGLNQSIIKLDKLYRSVLN